MVKVLVRRRVLVMQLAYWLGRWGGPGQARTRTGTGRSRRRSVRPRDG